MGTIPIRNIRLNSHSNHNHILCEVEKLNLKMAVSVMLGLLGVALTILFLQDVATGPWETVAQSIAPLIAMIGLIGFLIIVAVKR